MEFVPYTQAVEMRDLGFNEPCWRVGNPNGHIIWKWFEVDSETVTVDAQQVLNTKYGPDWVEIPTHQQCFNWFRKQYGLHSDIISQQRPNNFTYAFKVIGTEIFFDGYDTYEAAELACLKTLIEIAKTK